MADSKTWTSMDESSQEALLCEEDVVMVSEPMNEGEGRSMHTTYLVTGGSVEARHRYSDFQWLYHRLLTELPGAMVPIIPHKRTLTKSKDYTFSVEFVEERRQNLEVFLQRVFEISEIRSGTKTMGAASPSLISFLKLSSGEDFDHVKNNVEKENPTNDMENDVSGRGLGSSGMGGSSVGGSATGGKSPGAKLGGLFSRAKTAAQNKLGSVELQVTKEESEIGILEEYISALELYIKSLTEASKNLVKSTKDRSIAIHDFAVPIEAWRKSRQTYVESSEEEVFDEVGASHHEQETTTNDDQKHSNKSSFSNMLSTVIKMSESFITMLDKQHLEEQNKLEFGIQRLELDMKAIRVALKIRKQFQLEYTASCKKIHDKKAQLEKANGGMGSERIQHDLKEIKMGNIILRRKLEDCSERIIREKIRVLPEIETALKTCILDYAEIQTDQSNVVSDAWLTLLENDH